MIAPYRKSLVMLLIGPQAVNAAGESRRQVLRNY
jgi:hypothetical protein